jgi:hypothetical protein
MVIPVLMIAPFQPVYAPSAISARGGKFRHLPGQPGYVTVSLALFSFMKKCHY